MNWIDWLKLTVYIFIIIIPISLLAYLTGLSQGSITYVQPELVEIKTDKPIEFRIAASEPENEDCIPSETGFQFIEGSNCTQKNTIVHCIEGYGGKTLENTQTITRTMVSCLKNNELNDSDYTVIEAITNIEFSELEQVQKDEDINKAIIECNEIIWERLPQLEQRILEQNETLGKYEETIERISWEKGELYGELRECQGL